MTSADTSAKLKAAVARRKVMLVGYADIRP
jgi:hypothetical protein